MTAQSQSDSTWRRGRTKIIATRRADIHTMDYNDNPFAANYFLDDIDKLSLPLSESSSSTEESDKEDTHKKTEIDNSDDARNGIPIRDFGLEESCNNNDFDQLEVATNNNDIVDIITTPFDSIVNSRRVFNNHGENARAFHLQTNSTERNEEANHDFTDTAVSRDRRHDVIIIGQGDTTQTIKYEPKKKGKHDKDNKDKKKSKFIPSFKFGWFDFLVGVLSIGLFFVDIGTDIELAVHYFRNSLWMYGGVTTGLIVVPSLVTCFLGLHWYIIDCNKEKKVLQGLKKLGDKTKAYQTPNYVWFIRFFFTLIQCGPVIRVIEYLYCGYKSRSRHVDQRKRKRYYQFMLYEDADSCLLRLFECFLEAAPQLTWQLYIVIDLKPKEDVAGTSLRVLAMLSSWGSLAISLTSYHKSLRNSHEEKAKMTFKSLPFYFIWKACETGGRMLCIAMFASAFRLWVFGPLVFHWAFMSGWLIMQQTTFYKNKCMEKVFNVICGYVMIFCFLNLREGQTRFRFLLFYFILYAENFIMLALWFRFTQDLGAWFHLWGFIVVLLLFVFHVTFQLLYYTFLHPTKSIKKCLPCTRYVICSSICYEVQPRVIDGDQSEKLTILEVAVEDKVHENEENS